MIVKCFIIINRHRALSAITCMNRGKMSSTSDVLLEIRLARIQIVVTLLIGLGSTLFAVGVGFGVTIPPTLQQIAAEGVESGINLDALIALSDYALNYALILVMVGIVLIIAGIACGLGSLGRIKKKALSSK
jgi:hypothetical protein